MPIYEWHANDTNNKVSALAYSLYGVPDFNQGSLGIVPLCGIFTDIAKFSEHIKIMRSGTISSSLMEGLFLRVTASRIVLKHIAQAAKAWYFA